MLLMWGDIADGSVIAMIVVVFHEVSDQCLQLMEAKDILEAKPVIFEYPEERFDPGIVSRCLIPGKKLRDPQVSEELSDRLSGHLCAMI